MRLNYSDFEYKGAEEIWKYYKNAIDFHSLRGKTVLDLACGAGGKGVWFAEKYGAKIIGIDISPHFIEQAKTCAKEHSVEEFCDFRVGDALDTKLDTESVDYIVLHDALEHIPNTENLFHECHRVLKCGGLLLFNFEPYYHFFGHHIWDVIPIPWLHLITTESFRVELYKTAVTKYPDAKDRIGFRIGKNSNGKEAFTYLNGITRRKFMNIRKKFLENDLFRVVYEEFRTLRRFPLNKLGKLPVLNELFVNTQIGVWEKMGKKD